MADLWSLRWSPLFWSPRKTTSNLQYFLSISTKDCKKTQNIVAFKCARIQDIFLKVLTKARISPLAAQSLSCRGAFLAWERKIIMKLKRESVFLGKNPVSPEPEIVFLQVGQLLSKPLPLAKDALQEEIIHKIRIRNLSLWCFWWILILWNLAI